MKQRSSYPSRRIACLALFIGYFTASVAAEELSKKILDLESRIATAVIRNDTAFIQRVFGSDFVYTGVRGETKGKQEILQEFASGKLRFTEMKFDDQRVRIYGMTAIVTGRATTKGESPQGKIRGVFSDHR